MSGNIKGKDYCLLCDLHCVLYNSITVKGIVNIIITSVDYFQCMPASYYGYEMFINVTIVFVVIVYDICTVFQYTLLFVFECVSEVDLNRWEFLYIFQTCICTCNYSMYMYM